MHTLDSRLLRLGNCFGQRFSSPGEVRYFVSLGDLIPSARTRAEGGHLIKVRPAAEGAPSQQHTVVVSRDSGSLTVSPSELEIQAGDGVLWHAADAMVSGFNVAGGSANFYFNSARIENDAVFTHTFGVPGRYEWTDPNGSGVNGTIEVIAFGGKRAEERDQWFEMLKKPAGIKITGKAASPASVTIMVGQTVFWSIAHSAGVAITDKRFCRSPAPNRG
jgi:plastocyanin